MLWTTERKEFRLHGMLSCCVWLSISLMKEVCRKLRVVEALHQNEVVEE